MEKTFGFAIRVGTTVLAGENIRKTVNDATGTARTGGRARADAVDGPQTSVGSRVRVLE